MYNYILYNSNNEIELSNNNEKEFLAGVRSVIIDYIVYCMDCNRHDLENLNRWLNELEDIQYNSYNTLIDYEPLFKEYGFKLIIK